MEGGRESRREGGEEGGHVVREGIREGEERRVNIRYTENEVVHHQCTVHVDV